MHFIIRKFQGGGLVLLPVIAFLLTAFSSCGHLFHEELPECVKSNRLILRYSHNIMNTDAFGSQVNRVNVALYSKDGELVKLFTAERQLTETNDYYVDVQAPAGTYDIIAWCEGEPLIRNANPFVLLGQGIGDDTRMSGAKLLLEEKSGSLYSNRDIVPLFYGYLENVEIKDEYGVFDLPPIKLIKDTHHIILQLQNMKNEPLDPSILQFKLEGSNSVLDYRNIPDAEPGFIYLPWDITPTYSIYKDDVMNDAPFESKEGANNIIPTGVRADFTTSRIMADREQMLTVTRTDTGEEIFGIPLVEYLMLVRGNDKYSDSPQEYLDRYDEYTLVFFISDDYTWMKARILINGWRAVPPQTNVI